MTGRTREPTVGIIRVTAEVTGRARPTDILLSLELPPHGRRRNVDLRCEGSGKPVSFGVLEDLARRVADGLDDGLDGVFHRAQGIEERVDKLIDDVLVFLFLCRARLNGLVEGGLPGLVAARGGAFAAAAATGARSFSVAAS